MNRKGQARGQNEATKLVIGLVTIVIGAILFPTVQSESAKAQGNSTSSLASVTWQLAPGFYALAVLGTAVALGLSAFRGQ